MSLCEAEAAARAARDAGGDLGTSCICQRGLTEQLESAPLTEGVTPVSAAQDEPEAAYDLLLGSSAESQATARGRGCRSSRCMRLWWWLGAVAAGLLAWRRTQAEAVGAAGSFAVGVACSSISGKLLHEQPAAAGMARGSDYGATSAQGRGCGSSAR